MYMSFMHNYTDMTNDVSAQMEFDIDNWSTSDLGIIMLMIAVIVIIQYSFFLSISWIQFIERNIIIVPAIIGLMLRFNFYFKRTTMKISVATSSIVKRVTINNNVKTNVVVKTFIAALTMIINLTVKRTYSVTVAVIKFVVKKPLITVLVYCFLFSMNNIFYFIMSYDSRTVQAVCLSLMILTVSFNHIKFVRRLTCLVTLLLGIFLNLYFGLQIGISLLFQDPLLVITNGYFILIFCLSFLHDLHSHEIVYIVVTLSIVIFAHDLALSFVEIPDLVNVLLYCFFMILSIIYCCTYLYYENVVLYLKS